MSFPISKEELAELDKPAPIYYCKSCRYKGAESEFIDSSVESDWSDFSHQVNNSAVCPECESEKCAKIKSRRI